MKLIDEWQKSYKLVSVQIQAAALALATGWGVMPQEWKDATPKWAIMICVGAFAFATIAGRVVQQTVKPDSPGKEGS